MKNVKWRRLAFLLFAWLVCKCLLRVVLAPAYPSCVIFDSNQDSRNGENNSNDEGNYSKADGDGSNASNDADDEEEEDDDGDSYGDCDMAVAALLIAIGWWRCWCW